MDRIYYRTNSKNEAFEALAFVSEQLSLLPDRTQAWKWVALGIDNALLNWILVALRDSSGTNVLDLSGRRGRNFWIMRRLAFGETLDEIEQSGTTIDADTRARVGRGEQLEVGPDRLAGFDTLLTRVQDPSEMGRYVHSRPLVLTGEQHEAIGHLHRFRNALAHFIPSHHSFLIEGFPTVLRHVVAVIRFLACDCGTAWLDEAERRRFDETCAQISTHLSRIEGVFTEIHQQYLQALREKFGQDLTDEELCEGRLPINRSSSTSSGTGLEPGRWMKEIRRLCNWLGCRGQPEPNRLGGSCSIATVKNSQSAGQGMCHPGIFAPQALEDITDE